MRTSSIFRSRWMALLWAAGMIWLALEVASAAGPKADNGAATADAAGQGDGSADVDAAAKALGL